MFFFNKSWVRSTAIFIIEYSKNGGGSTPVKEGLCFLSNNIFDVNHPENRIF